MVVEDVPIFSHLSTDQFGFYLWYVIWNVYISRDRYFHSMDRSDYGDGRLLFYCRTITGNMTYEEYIREQQTAFAEEHSDKCCFLENQAEGVFVRGH